MGQGRLPCLEKAAGVEKGRVCSGFKTRAGGEKSKWRSGVYRSGAREVGGGGRSLSLSLFHSVCAHCGTGGGEEEWSGVIYNPEACMRHVQ